MPAVVPFEYSQMEIDCPLKVGGKIHCTGITIEVVRHNLERIKKLRREM